HLPPREGRRRRVALRPGAGRGLPRKPRAGAPPTRPSLPTGWGSAQRPRRGGIRGERPRDRVRRFSRVGAPRGGAPPRRDPAPVRALRIARPGGPEVLEIVEVPEPACGREEVLVRVRASGLNRADLLQRRGLYPAPPGSPADI